MTIEGALQATARWSARALGREFFVSPAYETLLECVSPGRGVHCTINGVTFHVDPLHRRQLSPNYDATVAAFLAKRVRPGDVCIKILVEMHHDSWALTGHTRSSAEELLVEIKRTPIALSCQRDPLGAHSMVCLEPM